jgi:hypothetical protein
MKNLKEAQELFKYWTLIEWEDDHCGRWELDEPQDVRLTENGITSKDGTIIEFKMESVNIDNDLIMIKTESTDVVVQCFEDR